MAQTLYVQVTNEDPYVQMLLVDALKARLQPESLVLIKDLSELPSPSSLLLQWREYEDLDLSYLLEHPHTTLASSFVIRKALTRKHYLSDTIKSWVTKHPTSILKEHVKPTFNFEVDNVDSPDGCLMDARELRDSLATNQGKADEEKEWWILEPGMSDGGDGVMLFSSHEELVAIFGERHSESIKRNGDVRAPSRTHSNEGEAESLVYVEDSHSIAQRYIHPPLLLPEPHPSAGRKFHIWTYVLAVGALKVYVYKPMLALFAGEPYAPPLSSTLINQLPCHITNGCFSEALEGNAQAFWKLPPMLASSRHDWMQEVFAQICLVTGEAFDAAATMNSIHFRPLMNAFELFGVDFLVDADGKAWLLEINASPDFGHIGGELIYLVKGMLEGVVDVAVMPFFGLHNLKPADRNGSMVKVLDIDVDSRVFCTTAQKTHSRRLYQRYV